MLNNTELILAKISRIVEQRLDVITTTNIIKEFLDELKESYESDPIGLNNIKFTGEHIVKLDKEIKPLMCLGATFGKYKIASDSIYNEGVTSLLYGQSKITKLKALLKGLPITCTKVMYKPVEDYEVDIKGVVYKFTKESDTEYQELIATNSLIENLVTLEDYLNRRYAIEYDKTLKEMISQCHLSEYRILMNTERLALRPLGKVLLEITQLQNSLCKQFDTFVNAKDFAFDKEGNIYYLSKVEPEVILNHKIASSLPFANINSEITVSTKITLNNINEILPIVDMLDKYGYNMEQLMVSAISRHLIHLEFPRFEAREDFYCGINMVAVAVGTRLIKAEDYEKDLMEVGSFSRNLVNIFGNICTYNIAHERNKSNTRSTKNTKDLLHTKYIVFKGGDDYALRL